MDKFQKHFRAAKFALPATPYQIAAAEAELHLRLPDALREMYLRYDGFREPYGDAPYLLPLLDPEGGNESLVAQTKHHWQLDNGPDFSEFLFFGISTSDLLWAMNCHDPSKIIQYEAEMGDQFETVSSSIYQVYLEDEKNMLDVVQEIETDEFDRT